MSEGPRRHHYVFAHRALPSVVFRFGADLLAGIRHGRLNLDALWDRVGQDLPGDQRLPATGLGVSHHDGDGHQILLVALPPAWYPPEAHYAAIALTTSDRRLRYFALEDSRSPVDGTRYTVLAEWTQEGSHLNLGPGPEPRPDALLGVLGSLLADRPQPA